MIKSKQYHNIVFWFSKTHEKLEKMFPQIIYYILYQRSTWIYTAMKYRLLQIKSAVYMSR